MWWLGFTLVLVGFALEEFILIKPVSTAGQSDPLSRRMEQAALWVPAVGIGLTGFTASRFHGVWAGGTLNGLGVVLCVVGVGLRFWARRTLGRFFTIGVVRLEGHRVVQTGPYRWVRHPGYLAFVLFYLGLPLIVGNWLGLLLLTLPALIIFISLVQIEDRRLAVALGSDYQTYQARSARWLPAVW